MIIYGAHWLELFSDCVCVDSSQLQMLTADQDLGERSSLHVVAILVFLNPFIGIFICAFAF